MISVLSFTFTQSDSGGPLVCKNGRKWVLHGITSWGKDECGSQDSPGVYTRVTRFMKWMESVMSGELKTPSLTDVAHRESISLMSYVACEYIFLFHMYW